MSCLFSCKKNNLFFFFPIIDPRISHEPARYPRYLPEAYCLCKGCLTGPNGEESDRFRSTPVYMPTVILRRTGSCVGGRHSYTESYVSIAVGCTCVPLLERDRKTLKSNPSVKRVTSKNAVSSTFRKNQLNWSIFRFLNSLSVNFSSYFFKNVLLSPK